MNDKPVLKNPEEFPDKGVLQRVLGMNFIFYEQLTGSMDAMHSDISFNWRFYNDGKAWVCKVTDSRRTMFWLSVFDGYFNVVFYFSAKAGEGIEELEIDKNIQSDFINAKFFGKVKPLVVKVLSKENIDDILKIVHYRKKH